MDKVVFFDIGGTLLTSGNIFSDMANSLDKNNKELPAFLKNSFNSQYKSPQKDFVTISEMLSNSLKKASMKFNLPDVSGNAKQFYEDAFVTKGSCFEDTTETLKTLKDNNTKIIAVTDADEELMLKELEHFKIKNYFDDLIISSRENAYKPSQKIVDKVKEAGKGAEKIVFVGDSKSDVETAQKVGAISVLIDRKGTSELEADHKIKSLKELTKIV